MPRNDEIRLACGELTAQEMRTAKAVLQWFIDTRCNEAEERLAAWYLAASPYATPSALLEGLRDLKRDAARYRWLREAIDWLPKFYNGWKGSHKGRFDFLWPSDEENLDAAIDAAMSSPSAPKGKE